ncbi:MAG: hypothetical protein K2X87_13290 [Gemmataceae bacterium]|nr:hypothetical protein [Gemmataceae bacterium]
MITGVVNAHREATRALRVHGPVASEDVTAVVDTGFSGRRALPPDVIARLGLTPHATNYAVLADGSRRTFNVYAADVEWGTARRGVLVSAFGDDVLVGMGLLAGHELRVEVKPGGAVEVRPLP